MDTVQIDEALFNIPDEAELELTCPNLEEMRVQRQERTVLTMKVRGLDLTASKYELRMPKH